MRSSTILAAAIAVCFVTSARAEDKVVKLPLKLEKGASFTFVVDSKSESSFPGRDGGEARTTKSSSLIEYTLKVKETGDEGTTLAVSFGKVVVNVESGDQKLALDKASKDKDSDSAEALRKVVEATHDVTVTAEGNVRASEDLAEALRGNRDDQAGFARMVLVRGAFNPIGDIAQIIGAGIHADELKVGETYGGRGFGGGQGGPGRGRRGARDGAGNDREISAEPQQDGQGQRRRGQGGGQGRGQFGGGRGFGGGGSLMRFEGADGKVAKFSILAQQRGFGRGGQDGERPEPTKIGEASFSLADGLLVRMSIDEKSPEDARFSRNRKLVIERGTAAAKKEKEAEDL